VGSERSARDNLEIAASALLAAATVASAWCAYQASLWNGEETRTLAQATVTQFASARRTTIASRNLTVDAATYLDYLAADLRGETKVAGFLRQHARPELKPALEAWIADKAAGRPDLPNPFGRPAYRLADQEAALELDAQAEAEIAHAGAANSHNDAYVLHTVLFALSFFFLGATSQARRQGTRRVMLVFGTLVFTLSVISLARLPRAKAEGPAPGSNASARAS
jgi:hypothetical protein